MIFILNTQCIKQSTFHSILSFSLTIWENIMNDQPAAGIQWAACLTCKRHAWCLSIFLTIRCVGFEIQQIYFRLDGVT